MRTSRRTLVCSYGLWVVLLLGQIGCTEKKTIQAQPPSYVGVGVELTMEAAGARVQRVLKNSSAEAASLEADDVILDVNGKPLRGQNLVQVVELLRGEPGTEVTLFVRTKSGNRYVKVTRKKLKNK